MAYQGPDRRKEDRVDGFAKRSVNEEMDIDKLDYRINPEAADTQERVLAMREAGRKTLLSRAGYTTDKAAAELSPVVAAPETVEIGYLGELKARFDALPHLHPGVQWMDVKKSLEADPAAKAKLEALDAKGYAMNVFRSKNNGEIQFRTAQLDVTKIAAEHRKIMYDKQAQTDYPQYKANGNAKDIAKSMGCELADQELYEQSRVQNGWVWVETDAATRETGYAFCGSYSGVVRNGANFHIVNGSFCAALRVKKAA